MNALTFTQEGITYETGTANGETVAYVIANNGAPYAGSLVIPGNVINAEINYRVYGIKDLGKAVDLIHVSIPASVETITGTAFQYCTSLENLRFEDGENNIDLGYLKYVYNGTGEGLFYNCPLISIYIGRNLNYDNSNWYKGRSPICRISTLKNVEFGNLVTEIGPYLCYKTSLESMIIPNSIETIGAYAFAYTNLIDIVIPPSVTKMGDCVFDHLNSKPTKIILEDGIEELVVGGGSSSNIYDVFPRYVNVYIGRDLKNILKYAVFYASGTVEFGDCVRTVATNILNDSNISELVFGEKTSFIFSNNLNDGKTLKSITCKSVLPPLIQDVSTFLPNVNIAECTLYVPKESIDLYKADSYWKKFYLIEGIDIGGSDKDDSNIDENASVKERLYLQQSQELDLTGYITGEEIKEWTCSNDDIVNLDAEKGAISALNFGEVKVRGKDAEGNVVAVFDIFVCPTVSIQYGEGKSYQHHVIYNSTPSLYIAAPEGYEIVSVSHDGEDVTYTVKANEGYYTPTSPITDNTVISVNLNSTAIPGDLNGDGMVDTSDLNRLLELMMNF